MPLNIADLEFQILQMADIAAIPDMTSAERLEKLADYQARADRLAFEMKQILDSLQLTEGGTPDYLTLRRLPSVKRKHAMARKAAERIQDAILKAEKAERQAYEVPANTDFVAQPSQVSPKDRRKKRT